MPSSATSSLATAAGLALLALPGAAQGPGTFLGVTFDGDFVLIDAAAGSSSVAFSTSTEGLQGMARAANGRLWCIRRSGATYFPALCRVDTVLRTASSFHPTFLNDATSLAVAADGRVLVADLVGGSHSRLFEIDLADPSGSTAHWIGDIKIGNQFPSVVALAFAPEGTLFAWSSSHGLIRIDPLTAQAVDVDGLPGGTEQMLGLAFGADGFLYGAYQTLYRVDPSTGATTVLGPLVVGIRALEPFSFEEIAVYCGPKGNSAGCFPAIAVQGSQSLSGPDDLLLFASGVLPHKPGVLLWSTSPAAVPFAGGVLCVGGPIRRTGAQLASGSSGCDGTYSYILTHAYLLSKGMAAGDVVHAQWWSRDGGFPSPSNVGLTDAAAIPLLP